MFTIKDYYNFTDFDKEPGGLRRLTLITSTIQNFQKETMRSNLRILDVGCGNGNISIPLASLGFEVTGVDVDSKSINKARMKNKFYNAQFVTQNIYQFNTNNKFDIVICSEIIEHLSNPLLFLYNIRKFLKRNGLLICTIPNGYCVEEIIRHFLDSTILGKKIMPTLRSLILKRGQIQTSNLAVFHLSYFTKKKFENILKNSGFRVIKFMNISFIFKQAFYIFLWIFIKRGSFMFRKLNEWDSMLSCYMPTSLANTWFFVSKT